MMKLFCGILGAVVLGCGLANATEVPEFELRARNAIGRLGVVKVPIAVKAEADGMLSVSFNAPKEGTYVLKYTTGPAKGKAAAAVRVEKAGPVTTKVKNPLK
jgi:hypothetical protein